MIGVDVKVTINLFGRFVGCGLEGRLDRIESLDASQETISVVIAKAQGIFLDLAGGRRSHFEAAVPVRMGWSSGSETTS